MTKILKAVFNDCIDKELKKPFEQIAQESASRTAVENSKYFQNLFNRQHENSAKGGKQ